ncbi:glycoside hydrolase N-terminal domain-containing protein [Clostridium estertheticum]|uniref:glycosyl hydrolase family 95 catalytic domain-containing protein n=1 Tax=Clostridium estertheticum TaxID=238834 RepID=UPI0013E94782|nr:glycoside hydrolase N-terminal domain-containing protein [Clostridium estertheticum]MBZ9686011.1 glycoside hydrolase N-terminal domain-containing protein [Clostridium estertheticum]
MESLSIEIPNKRHDLFFESPIMNWDEALPLGNGLTGCLVWGNGNPISLSLDRGDLWDTTPAPETLESDFTYKELIKLVKNQDDEGIRKKFDDCYSRVTPTKIPTGKLEISYGTSADMVKSHLSLSSALTEVKLNFGEKCSRITTFLHASKAVGYIVITGDAVIPEVKIKSPKFGIKKENEVDNILSEKGISNGSLQQLKYPPVEWGEEGYLNWFVQKTSERLEYGIVLAQKKIDDRLELCYYIASNNDCSKDWLEEAKNRVMNALEEGFDKNLKEHEKWWKNFWQKSSICLPDKEFEKQWYLTNYLFGSCSRKGAPPMPLQGVWTADNGQLPPWKGDYHNDLNTQMSYYHYLKANHMKEGESFIDFLWNLVPQAQKFAKKFFDAPGLCLPSVMSIDGNALGGWPMYSINLTNQIWLCQSFEKHWKFTGDDAFLREKAYPYFKETALCILRWLETDESGKMILPLSSSPEIHDNSLKAWLTPNSNYDLALLKYLFKNLHEMSSILNSDDIKKWQEVLSRLPELAVNEHNVLMLSPDESLTESHRHFSHAMAIHPLNLMDYNGCNRDRQIVDATVENLEVLGTGYWVGFSFTWMSELYALQGNGEGAAYQLKLFWDNLCSQNGFHLNGDFKKRGISSFHYRPFTLESNICAADALQEMLLQTSNGVIRVFPAILGAWKKEGVSFRNFRGENGVLISSEIKNEKVEYIKLKIEKGSCFRIQNRFGKDDIVVENASGKQMIHCKPGDIFSISVQKGEEYTLKVQ